MSNGMVSHYISGKHVFMSRLASASTMHKEGETRVTWDIGVEYKDLEKEVREFYHKNGYTLIPSTCKTKYTFVKNSEPSVVIKHHMTYTNEPHPSTEYNYSPKVLEKIADSIDSDVFNELIADDQ